MEFDIDILQKILNDTNPYYLVCDIYFVKKIGDGILMEIKYYDRSSKYSVLQANSVEISINKYTIESRKMKINKIIKNKNYGN